MQTKFKNRGYTLVEAIIYVSILSIFFIVIINSLLSFTRPYKEILVLRTIERSGLESMEKMAREIRAATTIDLGNSTFGVDPGELTLISNVNGVSTSTNFFVENGILRAYVNGVYLGPLTNSTTTVSSLIFRRLSNSVSEAVKIDMTIQMSFGSVTKSKSYHSTVILKSVSS